MDIKLRIILEKPPTGVCFGLQSGSGTVYDVLQKQWSDGNDPGFDFSITVKPSKTGTAPDFSGKIVQGKAGERFIYIDIGTAAGDRSSLWTRRLKVPLTGIDQETIERLSTDSDLILVAKVAGTAKDGGPNCATVKPFSGWKVQKPL